MRTLLKIIGLLVVILVVLSAGAILALPWFFSSDLVQSKVAEFVEQKTGRKLVIAGDSSLSLYPDIAVALENVTLSNPPGMKGGPLVKMATLRTRLKLLPLFRGRAEIGALTMIGPRFNLLVTKNGRRNWDFGSSRGNSGSGGETGNGPVRSFRLGQVSIKNGFIHYRNETEQIDEKIEAINVAFGQKSGRPDLRARGNLRWKNEVFNIATRINSLEGLLAGKPSRIHLEIKSHLTNCQYDGIIDAGENPGVDGELVSDTPSLRNLAAFLGHDLPAGRGFGKLRIRSHITANARLVSFKTGQFLLDNMRLAANGSIRLDKPRPDINLELEADRLDLTPYLADTGSKGEIVGGGPGAAAESPFDLSGLKKLDGNFVIRAGEILYKKGRLGAAQINITIKKGRANVGIDKLKLYRGTATGKFVLDGNGSRSFVGGNFSLKNVLTGAILRDFAGFDKLAGKGNLNGDFTARGNSIEALKKSLKGTASLKLLKGRIEGFNLARYVSDLTGNNIPGSEPGIPDKPMTAYDNMSAVFRINKGIARNKDFLLTGKFFRIRASGQIDLVKKSLRLRVAPNLFSGNWHFAPPLKVRGSWSKPRVSLDALAFLGGTDRIVRSITGLVQGKSIDAASLLKNRGLKNDQEIEAYLSGKKIDTSADQPASDNQPETGNDGAGTGNSALDQLLGKGKNRSTPLTDNLIKKLFP